MLWRQGEALSKWHWDGSLVSCQKTRQRTVPWHPAKEYLMPSRTHRSEFSPRQYMLSADYEVFYYSDLHFTSVGTHAHDFYEFYFFVEGSVEMEIAGSRRALSPGDLIIVPPHVPHRAIISDSGIPYRRYVLWMSRGYCGRIGSLAPDCTWIIRETAERWARSTYAADAIPSAADPRPASPPWSSTGSVQNSSASWMSWPPTASGGRRCSPSWSRISCST